MARDYTRVQELYLQLHDLQPSITHYHNFDIHNSDGYEMTDCDSSMKVLGGSHMASSGSRKRKSSYSDGYEISCDGSLRPPSSMHSGCSTTSKRKTSSHNSDGYEMTDCDSSMKPLGGSHMASSAPRKRKSSYSDGYEMSCDGSLRPPSSIHSGCSTTSKRKASSHITESVYDDDGSEDARSTRTLPDKKQNHSEIEKRRRDKMNTYITELSAMVPMCGAMARKLDKLTVLRMAVQHLRSVRGTLSACPLAARPRPAYLADRDLNALVMQAAHDCFLLVVGCDRGRLLYVSASVKSMLHYDQSELLGQSLFDILHPKDVAKVKEQLSSSDLSPRERLIDAKTMLPLKADVVAGASRLCPGSRRSFCCRIKSRVVKDEPESAPASASTPPKLRKKQAEKKYSVVQCTGYLKSWAPAEISEGGSVGGSGSGGGGGGEDETRNLSCLVAVARALPSPATSPPAALRFVSRHAPDGKFLFVDQRVSVALGFLPQELLGTSLYEHVGSAQLGGVARAHKAALLQRAPAATPPYAFRRKDGLYATLQTHFKPFRNPWTKDVECLVASHALVTETTPAPPGDAHSYIFKRSGSESGAVEADAEMQRLIESQVESHKIGSAIAEIAEEVLRCSSAELSPELPADLLQDAVFGHQYLTSNVVYQQASLVDNLLGEEGVSGAGGENRAAAGGGGGEESGAGFGMVRNNVSLGAAAAGSPAAASPAPSPPLLDGNGEAAMAVIMSLLEADAGLGGPVNFSGLPWPLP